MMTRKSRCLPFVAASILMLSCFALPIRAGVAVEDISPDVSRRVGNGAAGRINNLAVALGPDLSLHVYAASEWGGLFKSQDGGRTWSFLNGHVPVVMQDVAVDPNDLNTVYATSLYDGRAQDPSAGGGGRSGIQVSRDGGITWARPATAVPAPGFNCGTMREIWSSLAVEGRAIIGLPPRERAAPRTKSTCPPIPL